MLISNTVTKYRYDFSFMTYLVIVIIFTENIFTYLIHLSKLQYEQWWTIRLKWKYKLKMHHYIYYDP